MGDNESDLIGLDVVFSYERPAGGSDDHKTWPLVAVRVRHWDGTKLSEVACPPEQWERFVERAKSGVFDI